jgi:hypothetical protein
MTNAAKFRVALITIVCAATFTISYSHIHAVALQYGNSPLAAVLYPITIDCGILVAALTLTARTGVNRSAKAWAAFARIFGFGATVFCNVAASDWAAATTPAATIAAVVVNLVPAIVLISTIELLIHGAHGTAASRARRTAKPAGNVTPIRKAG